MVDEKPKEPVKVYVVYDPLYEEVISVHWSEDGAIKKCNEVDNEERYGEKRTSYYCEFDVFEVLD